MRIGILADIHGNFRALQAVMADLDRQEVDEILSLGDNIGYGPEPEEVVRELCRRAVSSVMGNHELGLISAGYFNRLNSVPRDSLRITRNLLSQESMAWVSSLVATQVRHGARFVHGCPPQSITTYLFSPSENRLRRLFSIYPQRLCFCGHTHNLDMFQLSPSGVVSRKLQPGVFSLERDARYIIVPGSVGQPRDGSGNKAKYAVWDVAADTVEIRAVEYDVETTIRLLKERDFPIFNAARLRR